ncbi:hypothetical protein BIV59_11610 [Bacillus sp. MUM 13]|nr:hypothetical protein BIV59_11610 [Bacillus sp. MUM 13]
MHSGLGAEAGLTKKRKRLVGGSKTKGARPAATSLRSHPGDLRGAELRNLKRQETLNMQGFLPFMYDIRDFCLYSFDNFS